MKTPCRTCGIAWMLLAGFCCLAGCENGGHFTIFGYTTEPTFDMSIKTVYVPIAKNTSYIKGLEFDLTKAVQRELTSYNSPYRLTSNRGKADTELEMKITTWRKTTILPNQLGEVRDAEVNLIIEVVWKDLRPGHSGDILSNPKKFDPNEKPLPGEVLGTAPKAVPVLITPTTTYAPELGGSNAVAQQQAINRAAKQIIQMMEVWR
jgi:hypothetical protein